MIYSIEIPVFPRSKKNSMQVIKLGNRYSLTQSKLYKQYEKECGLFVKRPTSPIDFPVNVKMLFTVPDRRKRDLSNLQAAVLDILVKYRVLKDDSYDIVVSMDGSRIKYIKNARCINIYITKSEDIL